jgi:hypothetical protein
MTNEGRDVTYENVTENKEKNPPLVIGHRSFGHSALRLLHLGPQVENALGYVGGKDQAGEIPAARANGGHLVAVHNLCAGQRSDARGRRPALFL